MITTVVATTGPAGTGPTIGTAAGRAGPRPAPAVSPTNTPSERPETNHPRSGHPRTEHPRTEPRVATVAGPPREPTATTGGDVNAPGRKSGAEGAEGTSGTAFIWPLSGTPSVLHRFAPGPHPWSPGHRGVDLGGSGDEPVLAAGAGTVSFAGMIAGRGVVAVRHPNGIRTTYEPVSPTVTAGQVVAPGQRIATLSIAVPGHCGADPCLHWGALAGERYLDPLSLLTGRRRPPVLLPVDAYA